MLKQQNLLILARLCRHRIIYQKAYRHLHKMYNINVISASTKSWTFRTLCDISENKAPVCSQGELKKEENPKCAGAPISPPPPCAQKSSRMALETKGSVPKSEPEGSCGEKTEPPKPCEKPKSPSPPSPCETPKPPSPIPPPCETQKPSPPPPCPEPPSICDAKPKPCPLEPTPPLCEPQKCDPPPSDPCAKSVPESPTDAVTPQTDQSKSPSGEVTKTRAAPSSNGQYSTYGTSSKPQEPKCTCGPPPEKCPENSKNDDMPTIPLKEARRFMYDCLVAAGAAPEQASLHADMMIFADTRGVFGHGMSRLETTCCNLKNKKISGKDIPEILNESPAVAFIDGKHALGAVIGCYCMDLAIKKAKICGIGFVNCKNATPFGYATFYADRATKNGLVGLAISNQPPTVIPTRAMEPAIGADPLGFAAPISFCDACNIDFSASVGSLGKVDMLGKQKKELPCGWAMAEGKPSTDPAYVLEKGGLLPLGGWSEEMGGHKGFCLGIMLEALTGILSGSDFGPKICKDKEFHYLSHTYMAINHELFAGGFSERLKWFSHFIRNMPPLTPGKNVLMPGDVERKIAEQVDINGGIKYLKAQMGQCQRIADEFKVKHLGEAKPNV